MVITELRIEGLRTIKKLRLRLDGLTVLIGDNGTGKSSILEACELLRRATSERFMDEFYSIHGGMSALLRQGAPELKLGVSIKPRPDELRESDSMLWKDLDSVEYDMTLVPEGPFARLQESLRIHSGPKQKSTSRSTRRPQKDGAQVRTTTVSREGQTGRVTLSTGGEYHFKAGTAPVVTQSMISASDDGQGEMFVDDLDPVRSVLKNQQIHLPFEIMPSWAARALDRKSALRASIPFGPTEQLEKLGLNLANVYHALRNNFGRAAWEETLEYVQLGLGEHVEDVVTWADPGGGSIGLGVKLKGLAQPIRAAQLSDGMLSYLAFVALFRLRGAQPSLLAFDEPDLHLHPRLLMRVLDMFESMAHEFPVVVTTHSDRLLDGLTDPARSVVLCELDESHATRLLRPDPKLLAKWLERYRGLGDIRGEGHEASVLTKEEPV